MPSKIYEFSLLDKYNTSEGDIMRTVEQTLASEADLQGWVSGYTYVRDSSPTKKPSGEIEYRFSVYGEFISSIGDASSDQSRSNQELPSSTAAKPAEL